MANDSTGWAVNGWKVPGHTQNIGAIVSHQQAQAKSILRTALFIKLKQSKNMYALFLLNNTFVNNYSPDPLREETSSIPLSQGLFWMISSICWRYQQEKEVDLHYIQFFLVDMLSWSQNNGNDLQLIFLQLCTRMQF